MVLYLTEYLDSMLLCYVILLIDWELTVNRASQQATSCDRLGASSVDQLFDISSPPSEERMSERPLSYAVRLAAVCTVVLVRVLVGYQPHSGQNNHHGSKVAYGGDFEAQRHWMEITVNLPVGEWYYYDLSYWGLDYPPLSAYQSWVCGKLSHLLVGPESVALDVSRGLEDSTHKAFMRATVIAFDLVFYASAAWLWTRPLSRQRHHTYESLVIFLRVMLEPSVLLIDHGHFQYNTAALGMALWSFYYCTKYARSTSMVWPVIGSIFFCFALSFKQMTLYYAPAVFAYLLGWCFQNRLPKTQTLWRFVALGLTVVTTFAVIWWPFVMFGPEDYTLSSRLLHVLRRIFPFQRGLFEGKVANLWCALSVQPFRLRARIPTELQPLAALVLTFGMILPACYKLFQIGRQAKDQSSSLVASMVHRRYLLWGAANTSLAFFLASFQVHEKSLLMAVAPISILAMESPGFSDWFSFVATWTMWPLLVLDRLQSDYYCVLVLFGIFLTVVHDVSSNTEKAPDSCDNGIFKRTLFKPILFISSITMIGLHTAEYLVEPPDAMPDIFPVLWSVVGCGFCLFAYLVSIWELYRSDFIIKEKDD